MTQLSAAIEAFVDPSFQSWRIRKDDGRLENFAPLALLQSFIEAEIPMPQAMELFDLVAAELEKKKYHVDQILVEGEPFTVFSYETIRAAVVARILRLRRSDGAQYEEAPFWLSSYDRLFGLPLFHKKDEGFVEARNASELKAIVGELLEGDGSGFTVAVHNKQKIVERITKYIRYCGFYRLEKEFLKDFVRAICFHSTKAVFFPESASLEEILGVLDRSETLLHSVREFDASAQTTIVSLATENAARAFLNYLGHITAPSAQRNRDQLLTLLTDAEKILRHGRESVDDDVFLAAKGVIDLFERSSHSPTKLISMLEDLISAQDNTFVRQATRTSFEITAFIRAIIRGEHDVSSFSGVKLTSASEYLDSLSRILAKQSVTNLLKDGYLEIPLDSSFHAILGFGRSINVYIDPEPDNGESFARSTIEPSQNGTISVVVTEVGIGGGFLKDIEDAAYETEACIVPIRRSVLERFLGKGGDVRDLILTQMGEHVPFMLRWEMKPFGGSTIEIPENLSKLDRARIEEFLADIAKNRQSTACQAASVFFETRLRSYCLMLQDLILRTDRSQAVFLGGAEKWVLGGMVEFLRDLTGAKSLNKIIRSLLLSPRDISVVNAIREHRNMFQHNDIAVDTHFSERFVQQIISCCSAISDAMSALSKVVSFPGKGFVVIFDEKDDVHHVEKLHLWGDVSEKRKRELKLQHPNLAVVGYCIGKNEEKSFIATSQCPKCRSHRQLSLVAGTKAYCSASCKQFTMLENDWVNAVAVAIKCDSGGTQMEKDSKSGEEAKSGWLRPLGEGVATALGPFGAPLKVYLSKLDRDDAAKLEEKIERLEDELSAEEVAEALVAELSQQGLPAAPVYELSYWLSRRREGDHALVNAQRFHPFSGSRFLEEEIIREICILYEGNDDLFWSDVRGGGVNVSRVRKTGVLEVDARGVITSMRGISPNSVFRFGQNMSEKNPGSDLFRLVAENLARITQ